MKLRASMLYSSHGTLHEIVTIISEEYGRYKNRVMTGSRKGRQLNTILMHYKCQQLHLNQPMTVSILPKPPSLWTVTVVTTSRSNYCDVVFNVKIGNDCHITIKQWDGRRCSCVMNDNGKWPAKLCTVYIQATQGGSCHSLIFIKWYGAL